MKLTYWIAILFFVPGVFLPVPTHAQEPPAHSTSPAEPGAADTAIQSPTAEPGASKRVGFGGKLGLSLATFVGDDARPTYANNPGLTLGGFVRIRLHEWISLQPELLYISKGPRVAPDGMLTNTFDVPYIEVPILARIRIPAGSRVEPYLAPYLLVGPAAGLLLSFEITDQDDGSVADRTDLANRIDLGLVLGAGARVPLSTWNAPGAIVFDMRYDRGLITLDAAEGGEDLKNRVFAFMLGYEY